MKQVKLSEFTPDPKNANKGTDRGRAMLTSSLKALGAGRSILVDKNNVAIAGNKTLSEAIAAGVEGAIVVESDGTRLIVVKRTDLDLSTDEKAKQLAIADNRIGQISLEWSSDVLAELSQEVDLSGFFTDDELANFLPAVEPPTPEEDEAKTADLMEQADEGKLESRVKLGEIWQCGRHRLIAGDCTDKKVIERLLGDRKLDLVFTDPPYGVSYADKNKSLNAVAPANRIQTPISGDHLSVEETAEKIWFPAFKHLFEATKPGGVYYLTAPQGGDQMMMMMMMMHKAGWLVKHELIWVKNNHVLGRADYHYKHEPIIYGWKPGNGHYFIESRSEFSVWNFDKPMKSDLHPTMKPVELIQYAIGNSSREGEAVGDFFLGSGSTLIACEKTGRICYGSEIDPDYATVIVTRFESFTGQAATLLGSL